MKSSKYLSHWSAIRLWNPPWVVETFESIPDLNHKLAMTKTHLTVPLSSNRKDRDGYVFHTSALNLPPYALTSYYGGHHVASPELSFLQVAHDLPLHHLIMLGYAFCSSDKVNKRDPLSTVHSLQTYAKQASYHRGRNQALQACRYIHDRASSFPEIATAMLLGLPHRLGGAGIGPFELNSWISLTPKEQALTGKQGFLADFISRKHHLIFEYNGFKYHSQAADYYADQLRQMVLECKGFRVIPIVSSMLQNSNEYFMLLRKIFPEAKSYYRIRTEKYQRQYLSLHDLICRGMNLTRYLYRNDLSNDAFHVKEYLDSLGQKYRPRRLESPQRNPTHGAWPE